MFVTCLSKIWGVRPSVRTSVIACLLVGFRSRIIFRKLLPFYFRKHWRLHQCVVSEWWELHGRCQWVYVYMRTRLLRNTVWRYGIDIIYIKSASYVVFKIFYQLNIINLDLTVYFFLTCSCFSFRKYRRLH